MIFIGTLLSTGGDEEGVVKGQIDKIIELTNGTVDPKGNS
jgi:hypothetical protein